MAASRPWRRHREITTVIKESMTDNVQLPRLYITWLTPKQFSPGDAELDVAANVLAGGKTSRLYKRLVYDLQVAQNVSAAQESGQLGSQFRITVTPKPSADAPQVALDKLKAIIDEELQKLRDTAPTEREMQRVMNGLEAGFYSQMERVNGQARSLNSYYAQTGNPDYFNEDLGRYRALSPNDITAAVRRWLPADKRLEFSVLPAAKK